MGKIVAIGGGEVRDLETLSIDQEIVFLTGKDHPRALFIPTASNDAAGYCQTFKEIYGEKLGCQTDELLLWSNTLSPTEIERKIKEVDLIYVGGGNTQRMLKKWRELDVDKMLIEAYKKGTVMSGLSAGSICWFEYGHSDSKRFSGEADWHYIRVRGLGLIPGIHCPHVHHESREESFEQSIKRKGGVGVALDNCTALEVVDGKYRIITSQGEPKAYKVYKKNGTVITEDIPAIAEFQPLAQLFIK